MMKYVLGAILGWGIGAAWSECMARRGPATVLYDGACPICRATVARLRRLDTRGALRMLDARDAEEVARRFPALPPDPELREMRVVFHGGKSLGGFEAVRALSAMLPPLWPVAPLLFLPGMKAPGSAAYRFIAANRPQTFACSEHSCPRR